MNSKLRIALFAMGLLALFSVLVRTIYLESAVVAESYQLRILHGEEGRFKNGNDALKADVEFRRNEPALRATALELGFEERAAEDLVSMGPEPKGH